MGEFLVSVEGGEVLVPDTATLNELIASLAAVSIIFKGTEYKRSELRLVDVGLRTNEINRIICRRSPAQSTRDPVRVAVKLGDAITLVHVDNLALTSDIKAKVVRLSADQYSLYYGCRELADSATLEQEGVPNFSTLHVIPRMTSDYVAMCDTAGIDAQREWNAAFRCKTRTGTTRRSKHLARPRMREFCQQR